MNKRARSPLQRAAPFLVSVIVIGGLALAIFWLWRSAEQTTTATVENVPYDVRVSISPTTITAGKTATVRLRVFRNGRLIDLEENGRLFHVMIVSANLRDAFHTYSPARVATGIYEVPHVFTEAGRYRIWTEIDDTTAEQRHDQYAERIGYAEIIVNGGSTQPEAAAPLTDKTIDSYRVRLITPPIVAGKPVTLRVQATDNNGKPAPLSSVEPFLYFISGKDFAFFRHGHGHPLPDGSGSLENTFPVAGQYVFWVQLEGENVNGIQVPFIFTVS